MIDATKDFNRAYRKAVYNLNTRGKLNSKEALLKRAEYNKFTQFVISLADLTAVCTIPNHIQLVGLDLTLGCNVVFTPHPVDAFKLVNSTKFDYNFVIYNTWPFSKRNSHSLIHFFKTDTNLNFIKRDAKKTLDIMTL